MVEEVHAKKHASLIFIYCSIYPKPVKINDEYLQMSPRKVVSKNFYHFFFQVESVNRNAEGWVYSIVIFIETFFRVHKLYPMISIKENIKKKKLNNCFMESQSGCLIFLTFIRDVLTCIHTKAQRSSTLTR